MSKLRTLASFAFFGAAVVQLAVAPWLATAATPAASAASTAIVVPINLVDADGKTTPAGTITATNTGYGLILKPALTGLPPGLHGFHVHEKPSCDPGEKDGQKAAALMAGGHYDPASTGRHEGPYGNGHLGDLPPIYIDAAGKSELSILAPRLKVADLRGHSLMLHAGGDNCSDHPAPLGGGGARMACGIVPAPAKP